MKIKKVISNNDLALFIDSDDDDIIYASKKTDLQNAILMSQQYLDRNEIPKDFITFGGALMVTYC
jgi:hypothetical protein